MATNKYLFNLKSSGFTEDTVKLLSKNKYMFDLPESTFSTPAKGIADFKRMDYKPSFSPVTNDFLASLNPEKKRIASVSVSSEPVKSGWQQFGEAFVSTPITVVKSISGISEGFTNGAAKMLRNTAGRIELAVRSNVARIQGEEYAKDPTYKGEVEKVGFMGHAKDALKAEQTTAYKELDKFVKFMEGGSSTKDSDNAVVKFAYQAGASVPTMLATRSLVGVPIIFNDSYMQNLEQYESQGMDINSSIVKRRAAWDAAVQVASEYTFNAYGKMAKLGTWALDKNQVRTGAQVLFKEFMAQEAAPTVEKQLVFLLKKGGEEGIEEVVANVGSGIIAKFTTNPGDKMFSWTEEGKGLISAEGAGKAFVAGGLMGFLFSAANNISTMTNTNNALGKLSNKPYENWTDTDYASVPVAIASDMRKQENIDAVMAKTADAIGDAVMDNATQKAAEKDISVPIAQMMEQTATTPAVATQVEEPVVTKLTTAKLAEKIYAKTDTDADIDAWIETKEAKDIKAIANNPEEISARVNTLATEIAEMEKAYADVPKTAKPQAESYTARLTKFETGAISKASFQKHDGKGNYFTITGNEMTPNLGSGNITDAKLDILKPVFNFIGDVKTTDNVITSVKPATVESRNGELSLVSKGTIYFNGDSTNVTEESTGKKTLKVDLQLLAKKKVELRALRRLADRIISDPKKGYALREHTQYLLDVLNSKVSSDEKRIEVEKLVTDKEIFRKIYHNSKADQDAKKLTGSKKNRVQYEKNKTNLIDYLYNDNNKATPADMLALDEFLNDEMEKVEQSKDGEPTVQLGRIIDLVQRLKTEAGQTLQILKYIKAKSGLYEAQKLTKQFEKIYETPDSIKADKTAIEIADELKTIGNKGVADAAKDIDKKIKEAKPREPKEPMSMTDKLAKMILDRLNKPDKSPKDIDIEKKILKALYDRFAETLEVEPKAKPDIKDFYKLVATMTIRSNEMTDVWTDAKTIVEENAEDHSDITEFLDIINPLYNQKQLKKLMYTTLKDMNANMTDMVREDFFNEGSFPAFNDRLKKNLQASVTTQIPEAEMNYLINEIGQELKDGVAAKKVQMTNAINKRLIGTSAMRQPKSYQEQMIKELTESAIIDGFNSDVIADIWKKRLGISAMTQEMRDKIMATIKKIHEAKMDNRPQSEIDKMYDDLLTELSQNAPVSGWDRLKAWKRMAMLFNPTTWISNAANNWLSMPMYKATNLMRAGFERKFGVDAEHRATVDRGVPVKTPAIMSALKENVTKETMKMYMHRSNKYSIQNRANIEKKIFGDSLLEKANKFTTFVMSDSVLGDMPVFERHFKAAFVNRMASLGFNESLNDGQKKLIIDKAMTFATDEATVRTFRAANALTKSIVSLQNKSVVGDAVISIMQPFIVTPVAVMYEGYKFSPVALAVELAKLGGLSVKTKGHAIQNLTQEERAYFAQRLPQALAGTGGQFAVGYLLAALGFMTGATPDDDKEKKAWEVAGKLPYSLYIPGVGSLSMDRFQPVSTGLIMGATVQNAGLDIGKIAQGAADAILKNSIIDNFGRLFGSGDWTGAGMDLMSDAIMQNFPAIFKKLSDTIDPYERDVYKGNAGQILLNRMISYTPFASSTIAPKVDIWGNPAKKVSSNAGFAGRAAQSFLMPFRVKSSEMDETTKAVLDVYKNSSKSSALPPVAAKSFTISGTKYVLNDDQYAEYQKLVGQKSYEFASSVVKQSSFKAMSPELQAKVLSKMYGNAVDTAKSTMVGKHPDLQTMVQ